VLVAIKLKESATGANCQVDEFRQEIGHWVRYLKESLGGRGGGAARILGSDHRPIL